MKDYTEKEAASLLPARPDTAHKGDFGFAVFAAGSLGMCGAGALSSYAALRAGCGKVTWIHPGKAQARPAWEVMTLPVGGRAFGEEDADEVTAFLQRADVFCLGPGLGRNPGTFAFVRKVLNDIRVPFVLDADGLMAYAGRPEDIPGGYRGILTPHEGEAAALLGKAVPEVRADREGAVLELAERSGCVSVLKGHETLISDGSEVWRNHTGNAGMATAGSGDVLTGILGGLLAQGMTITAASLAGVCLHGAAGDLAAEEGARGMTASDILLCVRSVLARWDRP